MVYTTDYINPQTQLRAADKSGYLNGIWSSLATTTPDLLLLCHGLDGQLPVQMHKAVLSNQSTLLSELLVTSTDPVLLLPEIEVHTVNLLLDLIYTGRCTIVQADWLDLRQLLTSLGMIRVAENLKICGNKQFEVKSEMSEIKYHDHVKRNKQDVQWKEAIRSARCARSLTDRKVPVTPVPAHQTLGTEYFCQMCGKDEKSPFNLRVHYTVKHFFSSVAGLVSDKTSPSCEVCGKQFEAEIQWNNYRNIVRHRGATHEEVMPFVRNTCGVVEIACHECNICQINVQEMMKTGADSDTIYPLFGNHLVEVHYEDKIKKLISSGQKNCNLCDKKFKSGKMLIAHIGIDHGFAMKFYRKFMKKNIDEADDIQVSEKKPLLGIRKKCKFCNKLIAGAGRSWKNPLYEHYSRRHFSEALLRDFTTEGNGCSVCGLRNISSGRMVVHLGVKHRLVERFLDADSSEAEVSAPKLKRNRNDLR